VPSPGGREGRDHPPTRRDFFLAPNAFMDWSNAMTTTIDIAGTHVDDVPSPEANGGYGEAVPQVAGRAVIAIELLTAHPGNVRRDISLDQEFLDSIAELGILTPLRITPDGPAGYRVIEGHRRLAAAEKLGLTEIPYDLAADREGDEAGQFLDMWVTNHHRKDLSALEEADALFAASANGATKTRIRKATGLGRDDVAAALKAGQMTGFAREVAAGFGQAVTLEQLALLAEFDGDTEAVNRLMNDFCGGRNGQHVAERIRQERAELAEHERLVVQFIADGYTVTMELPPGAIMLHALLHDEQDLTEEAHATCPGRAVYFAAYQPHSPRHFCTDPEANGHVSRYRPTALPDLRQDETGTTSEAGPHPEDQPDPVPDPARRLVIEGNRAWVVARTVRKRWLADNLLSRRTAPKEALPFVTAQLLTMPQVLRDAITRAPRSQLFDQLTGENIRPDAINAWSAGRLPLALLAVIATAYEDRMDGDGGRATWRTDQRFTQCNREDAGAYLRFLASVGYELSTIEQAVADGVPYTGDQPGDELSDTNEQHLSTGEATGENHQTPACAIPAEIGPEARVMVP
jgi:ParB family chromosome partitioning protein